MNPLQCHDAKVLEHASVYLTRIVETFASSPEEVDALCKHGLVDPVASLGSANNSEGEQASFSIPTYERLNLFSLHMREWVSFRYQNSVSPKYQWYA